MGNTESFDWDHIWNVCSKLLADSIAMDKEPISNASELYRSLLAAARDGYIDEALPKAVTFRRKLHQKLSKDGNDRICKNALYEMIEQYDKIAISALAKHLKLMPTSSSSKACYLFLRISDKRKTNVPDHSKLLHSVSAQLKKKYPTKILFITYDNDTIVMLSPNTRARDSVIAYLQRNNMDGAKENETTKTPKKASTHNNI